MVYWSIPFETMAIALETVRGTAVTPPTHRLPMAGVLTPVQERYREPDEVGTLEGFYRSETIRKLGRWKTKSAALDVTYTPLIQNIICRGGVTSPVTPGGEVTGTVITAPGSGYGAGTIVTFTAAPGGGRTATGIVVLSAGTVTSIQLTDQGRGYTVAPTPTISGGGGSGATATSTIGPVGVLSKLWETIPNLLADDRKTFTGYWGDPNVKMLQGAYSMLDKWEIESNAGGGKESAKNSLEGTCQFPTDLAAPSLPAISLGPLIVPARMQLWIDTGNDHFGKTAVVGRLISAKHSIPGGMEYLYPATGPAGGVTYDHIGPVKRHVVTSLQLEVPDLTQFNNWKASDICKVRVRHNGPLIELISSTNFYQHFEIDVKGPLDGFEWGALQNTNRLIEVMVMSEYDAVLGASWAARTQNLKTAL